MSRFLTMLIIGLLISPLAAQNAFAQSDVTQSSPYPTQRPETESHKDSHTTNQHNHTDHDKKMEPLRISELMGLSVMAPAMNNQAENQPASNQQPSNQQPSNQQASNQAYNTNTQDKNHRSSNKNDKYEEIGSIEDVVLDTKDGSVKYVAVSMGGFLGVGDKLFAVPFEKLSCMKEDGEYKVTLDINKQRLQNAKGFDQDNWPNMADPKWRQLNDKPYESTDSRQARATSNR